MSTGPGSRSTKIERTTAAIIIAIVAMIGAIIASSVSMLDDASTDNIGNRLETQVSLYLTLTAFAETMQGPFDQTFTPSPARPTEVAIEIVNISGQEIGEGTIRLYTSDTEISRSETVRVEIEIHFDYLYITPTPFGEVTRIPVHTPTPYDAPTANPRPATPTITPVHISDPGQVFYQLMGASLNCSPQSFDGCVSKDSTVIGLDGHRWVWILSPHEGAEGLQNLQAEVWTLQTVSGEERVNIVWQHDFQLRVVGEEDDDDSSGISTEIIVAIIGLISTVLVALIGIIGSRRASDKPKPSTEKPEQVSDLRLFISYRRVDSEAWAKLLYESLKPHFAKDAIFRDIEHIDYGDDFRVKINEAVWSCGVLIALIGKKWLRVTAKDTDGERRKRIFMEGDYVRREIAAALERNIRVIPVLVDGAKMPSADDLPDDLKKLAYCNAVNVRSDSYNDDIKRLLRQLIKDES